MIFLNASYPAENATIRVAMSCCLIVPVVETAAAGISSAASYFSIRASTFNTNIAINLFIRVSEEMVLLLDMNDAHRVFHVCLLFHNAYN